MFFDDFKDSQSVCYELLKNCVLSNKVSHAYLFDGNGSNDTLNVVFSFVKMLICPSYFSKYSELDCGECNICRRIDDGNYPEVKVIESDSLVIKKEQLLELQSDFSTFSVEGKYRIYIIKDCDKMNKQASNSLLKFLEEPSDNIIAILVTNNITKLLPTIVSRCQVIHLNNGIRLPNEGSFENFSLLVCDSAEDVSLFVGNEKNRDIFKCVLDFIIYFEENGLDALLFMKNMWYNCIQTREENLLAFQVLIYFYYDVLKFCVSNSNYLFCSDVSLVEKVAGYNTLDTVIKKLDIIQYGYDMFLCNLNSNLLLDDIIIRLGDVR